MILYLFILSYLDNISTSKNIRILSTTWIFNNVLMSDINPELCITFYNKISIVKFLLSIKLYNVSFNDRFPRFDTNIVTALSLLSKAETFVIQK